MDGIGNASNRVNTKCPRIFEVNIYLETSLHGPAVRSGTGEWIVEYIKTSGKPEVRRGMVNRDKTTENALTLFLLWEALGILTRTCQVRIYTSCPHILNTMQNNWLAQWERNGWINAKGKPVKNADLWKKCMELGRNHYIEVDNRYHSRMTEMQEDIRKEMEKPYEKHYA